MKALKTEVVVLGAGPGGYAAAFYAADRGKKVIMVEQEKRLGGVCLNRGCIPSKAYLHAAKLVAEAEESAIRGVHFAKPRIDLGEMRAWKESILDKLALGITGLAKRRNVEVMQGRGYFEDSTTLRVETSGGQQFINFETAIIAVGSKAAMPAAFDLGNPRVMTSTEALELEEIPKDLLVVGGGYIGMELGTVYATLGSSVVVVEALETILTGADPDLARPVAARAGKMFREIRVSTKVMKMATAGKQIRVNLEVGGRRRRSCTTGCLSPSAESRTARISGWRTRASSRMTGGSSGSTSTSGQRIPRFSPSVMSREGFCSPTRPRKRRAWPSK